MTIQDKIKSMHHRMAEMRDNASSERKQRCFELLHDAVVHTGPRIDDLNHDSLVGFIELAAQAVTDPDVNVRTLRDKLISMGFNTAPVN
jgi:hypothetical protein